MVDVEGVEPPKLSRPIYSRLSSPHTLVAHPYLVAKAGFEPATVPLSGEYSTSELLSYIFSILYVNTFQFGG